MKERVSRNTSIETTELWRLRGKRWIAPVERYPRVHEFLVFGIKQAWSCIFGGMLLALILLTAYWNPLPSFHRGEHWNIHSCLELSDSITRMALGIAA